MDRSRPQTSPSGLPLATALMLDIFDEPIVFHRAYVAIAGSITAALFLSYAGYAYADIPEEREGWFTRTQNEWERDTGLTRREQETARRQLRERGLLEERRVGMPAVLWYRVNWARLRDSLERQSRSHWAGRLDE
ncbi:MAG TPA: hypothetical protein PLW81_01210 [Thiobacillaceae bacterium]|nr:hypothetical protein [Thiobacillaceae bacterium]